MASTAGASAPLKGILSKRGQSNKAWKSRYCVVLGASAACVMMTTMMMMMAMMMMMIMMMTMMTMMMMEMTTMMMMWVCLVVVHVPRLFSFFLLVSLFLSSSSDGSQCSRAIAILPCAAAGSSLYYYENEGDREANGSIDIRQVKDVYRLQKPGYFDVITEDRTYHFKAKVRNHAVLTTSAHLTTSFSLVQPAEDAARWIEGLLSIKNEFVLDNLPPSASVLSR
jgi:hypothetical protein